MSDWPIAQEAVYYGDPTPASSSMMTVVSAGNAAWGSMVTLVASSPVVANEILLMMNGYVNVSGPYGVGIYVNSQQVIEPIILGSRVLQLPISKRLPFHVPYGANVQARAISQSVANWLELGVILQAGGFGMTEGFSNADTLGVTSLAFGTLVNPGAAAHAWGGWTTVGTATDNYRGLLFSTSKRGFNITSNTIIHFKVGINSQEVIGSIPGLISYGEDLMISPIQELFFPISVASGALIQVRSKATQTGSVNKLVDFVVHVVK